MIRSASLRQRLWRIARWSGSKPCRGEPGCFWITFFFPMHLKTIAPDVTIPYTAADYHALRDPVLDYVLQAATAHPGPT
jgi:hypothetical protein